MSFKEFVDLLWAKRLMFLAGAGAMLLTGALYIYIATPVYQAQAQILPVPSANAVYSSYSLEEMPNYNEVVLFEKFFLKVNSRSSVRRYLANKKIQTLDEKVFFENLSFKRPSKKEQRLLITLNLADEVDVATYLNEYINFVITEVIQDIGFQVEHAKATNKEKLNLEIDLHKSVSKQLKNDRLTELEFALNVARELGYEKPLDYEAEGLGRRLDYHNNIVDTGRTRLYARGVKELEAEIDSLKNMKEGSNSAELRNLEALWKKYDSITIDTDALEIVKVDYYGSKPDSPIKPNKLAVILASIIFGIFLSVLLILSLNALKEE